MKKTSFLVLACALLARSGYATEWHILGTRAMGMGGAGVAVAEGPVGAYWNPASLGRPESASGVQVPVDVHAELTGQFLEGANDLNDISKACQASGGLPTGKCTVTNINAALSKINHAENGIRADAALGAHVKIKKLAFFVNNLLYLAGIPKADLTPANITPANLSTLNNSKLTLRGLSITEIGVGYGHELPFLPGLIVGGNLKALVGKAGYHDILLRSDSANDNIMKKFTDGAKQSVAPGVDLGLLWDVRRTFAAAPLRPRVGLTMRNINNPKFDNPGQATAAGERARFPLQSNTRLGVALSPFNWWHVAMDADLSRNLTPVDGVATQNVSLGTEVNVFNRTWLNIPLRAGITRNMAMTGSKTAYTGGVGFNFLHFTAELAALVSSSSQQIKSSEKSEKFPSALGVSAQIGMLFGGGKQEEKAKDE